MEKERERRRIDELLSELRDGFGVWPLLDGSVSLMTPFLYGDGDGFCVVLHRSGPDRWRISDGGNHDHGLWLRNMDAAITDEQVAFMRRVAKANGLTLTDDHELTSPWFEGLPTAEDVADFIAALAAIDASDLLEGEF